MRKVNIICSIVILIMSCSLYYYSSTFPVRAGRLAALNTGFYPKILAIILGVLAISLLISALRDPNRVQKDLFAGVTKRSFIVLFVSVGMLIAFPIILEVFGLVVATFCFIAPLTYLLSDKSRYKISTILLVSVTSTAFIYFVFKAFLRIPFPVGIIFS